MWGIRRRKRCPATRVRVVEERIVRLPSGRRVRVVNEVTTSEQPTGPIDPLEVLYALRSAKADD